MIKSNQRMQPLLVMDRQGAMDSKPQRLIRNVRRRRMKAI
jgi:hypothetical protein